MQQDALVLVQNSPTTVLQKPLQCPFMALPLPQYTIAFLPPLLNTVAHQIYALYTINVFSLC